MLSVQFQNKIENLQKEAKSMPRIHKCIAAIWFITQWICIYTHNDVVDISLEKTGSMT
jgi:hypothetical protein